jgi:hypothetical protein
MSASPHPGQPRAALPWARPPRRDHTASRPRTPVDKGRVSLWEVGRGQPRSASKSVSGVDCRADRVADRLPVRDHDRTGHLGTRVPRRPRSALVVAGLRPRGWTVIIGLHERTSRRSAA